MITAQINLFYKTPAANILLGKQILAVEKFSLHNLLRICFNLK